MNRGFESHGVHFFNILQTVYMFGEKTRTCEMDSNGCIPGLKVKRPQEGSHCFPSDRITMRIPFSAPTFFVYIMIHAGMVIQCSSMFINPFSWDSYDSHDVWIPLRG